MPGDAAYSCGAVSGGGEVRLLSVYGCRGVLYRRRFCDCVVANNLFFFLRRKKKREKERPLRGLRREVRFIMSPPGKRRHNELNAAPPPETPRRTGKPGAATHRDVVHSGESFRIRAKTVRSAFPSRAAKQGRGNESVSGGDREPRLTEPQRDSSARRR